MQESIYTEKQTKKTLKCLYYKNKRKKKKTNSISRDSETEYEGTVLSSHRRNSCNEKDQSYISEDISM